MKMNKTILTLIASMLPLLSICQSTDSSDSKSPSDIPYLEIYKGLKQEENLRYLATEQYLLLLEKDVIINQLLSEIEQLKEIRLLDEERFRLKDEIIEQHKKRRISNGKNKRRICYKRFVRW